DDERRRGVGEARPIEIEWLVRLAVAGDVAHSGRKPAGGQRHAPGPSATLRPRAAGEPPHGKARALEPGCLLAATPEDKRVSALQANDATTRSRRTDENLIDDTLRNGVMAGPLADIDAQCPDGDERQDPVRNQAVVNHDVRRGYGARRLERQQLRIARSGTNQIHLARCHDALR